MRYHIAMLLAAAFAIGASPDTADADKRGVTTSRSCPYSCRTQGIPKNVCRDWREGNTCFIEDLRKPPGHANARRPLPRHVGAAPVAPAARSGLVTAGPCPHSCQAVGLDHNVCRDWREGNTCFVEDLTRTPDPGGIVWNRSDDYDDDDYMARYDDRSVANCSGLRPRDSTEPRIDIERVRRTGNFFDDDFKVEGVIEGVCITRAGVYEDGRKVADIPVQTTQTFRRQDFEVRVDKSRDPEIRVYNSAGQYDRYDVDVTDHRG